VCLKRKIRDYVAAAKAGESKYEIFIRSGQTLEAQQRRPYESLSLKAKSAERADIAKARSWMCETFYDVRAFGAVMSTTDFNCGQVRGPVQITFARSLDRVFSSEHCITRVAYTKEEKAKATTASTEMGRKHTVAYGLYRAYGFINPMLAAQTGFTNDDLNLLWRALQNMFDLDRSAARGLMTPRGLVVFQHSSGLGDAPAQQLFDRVQVSLRSGIESPREFSDYTVTLDEQNLPAGISILEPLAAHA
jgi:CRISPR-associated protein Csd2